MGKQKNKAVLKREIDGLKWKDLTMEEQSAFLSHSIEFDDASDNFMPHNGYIVDFLLYDSYISQEDNDDQTCYSVCAYRIKGKYVPDEDYGGLRFTTNFEEYLEVQIDDDSVVYKSMSKED